MNNFEIDIALEFANKRQKIRLKKNNKFYRRRIRSKLHHYLYSSESLDIELSVIEEREGEGKGEVRVRVRVRVRVGSG